MREESPLAEKIRQVIEPSVHDQGFRIVLVRTEGAGRGQSRVVILAEPLEDRPITLDECAIVSRTASTLLDVHDPISGNYTLEVSSPGIDRPLVCAEDFSRFVGLEAKVEMREPIDGRKRFKGRILGVENGTVRLHVDEVDFELNLSGIESAKLVLSDELINFMQKKYGKKTD